MKSSRIRTGKLSIRPSTFDLSQTVANLLESFAAQISAAQSRVNFTACQSVTGQWDEFRIEQVVSNLLTNALRYGARKPVEVSVYVEGANAIIDVRDQGIGISEENQQRIFHQFERVAGSDVVNGLGLGLFISEQIIAAHNGSISVHSTLGEGALFRVSLPLEQKS